MTDFKKGLQLFLTSWVILFLLFFLKIVELVYDFCAIILDSRALLIEPVLATALLLIVSTHYVNKRFIKANRRVFIFSQILFLLTFAVFLLLLYRIYFPPINYFPTLNTQQHEIDI